MIAFYMSMTSFLLLPVVTDILAYYMFPKHYSFGVCVEMVKMSPLCLVVMIFYALMIVTSTVMLCMHWFKGSNVNVNVVTTTLRQDDEPALLKDNDDNENDGNDIESTKNNNNGGSHGNYVRNITENKNFGLNGKIKTVDEMVGYEVNEKSDKEQIRVIERQNKCHKWMIVIMAVLEPWCLWSWVVVLHGNRAWTHSSNIDYGSMTSLWTVIAACYTLVSACFTDK